MKDPRDIIIRPVVSEKSYQLIETNVYTFIVHPDAAKPEIRNAIEEIFDVKVTSVNTLNRKGKTTRNRRTGKAGSLDLSGPDVLPQAASARGGVK